MCRKHSSDDDSCKNNSTVDSPAQAFFPPLRIVTQPTAPGDRDRARKVIDTNNLDEQDLKNLKKYDRFLYYSIPTVVRDAIRAKAKVVSNEEFQVQVQMPLQDGSGSKSSIDSNSTATATMVERKTRISYECHPDLLLESLLDDDPGYSVEQEQEHEDCVVDVDPILQLMYNTTRRQRQ